MTARCNACLQDVSEDQIADPATNNTGGDTICLRCHREATNATMRTYIERANGDCWNGDEWINLNFAPGARDACDYGSYEAAAGYLDAALTDDESGCFDDARVVTVEDGQAAIERIGQFTCSICHGPIEPVGDWTQGNNAQPINDGRCCGGCNASVVIPARLREFNSRFPREIRGC